MCYGKRVVVVTRGVARMGWGVIHVEQCLKLTGRLLWSSTSLWSRDSRSPSVLGRHVAKKQVPSGIPVMCRRRGVIHMSFWRPTGGRTSFQKFPVHHVCVSLSVPKPERMLLVGTHSRFLKICWWFPLCHVSYCYQKPQHYLTCLFSSYNHCH